MKRKILSIVMALALCLGLLPGMALAASCGHDHSEYTALTSSSSTLQSGKYYLAGDLTTQKDIYIPQGAEVEICLNGHTLAMNGQGSTSILGPSGTAIYSAVSADAGVTLTIENGNIVQSGPSKRIMYFKGEGDTLNLRNCDLSINNANAIGVCFDLNKLGIANITDTTLSGTLQYGVFMQYGQLTATDFNVSGYSTYGILINNGSAELTNVTTQSRSTSYSSIDVYMNTGVDNLSVIGGAPGSVYLECAAASFKNCTLRKLVNNTARISEISGVTITCDEGNCLQNSSGGVIDKIENCTFTAAPGSLTANGGSTVIYNEGTISQITGGTYRSASWFADDAALRNSGIVSDISGDAKFYGANAIKNDAGSITVNSATAVGTVDPSWENIPVEYKIYACAVAPSASGTVTVNGGNYGCGVYRGSNENDLKLFSGNTGITVNGGNFQLPIPSSLLPQGKTNVDSGNADYPYTIGEPAYSITYNLAGGENHSDNPVFYSPSAGVPELKAPTKSGYRFTGWVDSSGNAITGIASGTEGDVTLTATWEQETVYYMVTLADISGFTADQDMETTVQQGHSYAVTLTAGTGYEVYPYDQYALLDDHGSHVNGSYSYDLANRTVTITVPDVQSDVRISYTARVCEHDYQETILQPADCTQEGAKMLKCSKCRQEISPVVIPAAGHRFVYSASGSQIMEACLGNCGQQETAQISALNGTASVTYSSGWQGGTLSISYTRDGQSASEPSEAGNYTAAISKDGVTATCAVTVNNPGSSSGSSSGSSGSGTSGASTLPVSTTGQSSSAVAATTTAAPVAGNRGGKASCAVSSAVGGEIVRQAVENGSGSVVIAPEITGGVTSTEVSIPAFTVGELGSKTSASLTISTPVAEVTIPNGALASLSGAGGTVTVAAGRKDGYVELTVTAGGRPAESIPGGVTLTVPMTDSTPGTVAVLVHGDGTRKVVRKSVAEGGGITIPLDGSARLELVDNSKQFSDVPAGSWEADAVAFASAREMFSGTGEGKFSPDLPMSRGMLAVVLYNLECNPEQALTGVFSDVSDGAWYAGGVAWAAENGIVSGDGNGLFGPDDNITREQLAVMLWRYAGSPAATNKKLNFKDADAVSSYALEAMRWAVENGILNGYGNGLLAPQGQATRAQVAQMLKNYMSK